MVVPTDRLYLSLSTGSSLCNLRNVLSFDLFLATLSVSFRSLPHLPFKSPDIQLFSLPLHGVFLTKINDVSPPNPRDTMPSA